MPVIIAACLGVSATTAFAQQATATNPGPAATEGLAEVIVTARRKEESQQDVPVSLTAITGGELTALGVTKTSDLSMAVPGLVASPASSAGPDGMAYNIRGIENRQPDLVYDSSVGVYFGEVPWARPDGSNAAFFDLQSVQVLMGPQGTLFGRNSPAGAILLTPNEPTQKLEGYVEAGGGNYGANTFEGVLNVPLSDTVALRLAVRNEERDGYTQNVSNGQWTDNINDHSFRGSLKFDPSDSFSSTLIANYYNSANGGPGERLITVVPLGAAYAPYLAQTNALPSRYGYLSAFSTALAQTPINGISLYDGWPEGNQTFAKLTTWSLQDTSTWNLGASAFFGDVVLKNIASYRHLDYNFTFQVAGVPVVLSSQLTDEAQGQYTDELQMQGKRGGLNYILGGFFFRESGEDSAYSVGPSAPTTWSLQDALVTNTSYAAFAHATDDLSWIGVAGLSLDAGVRITRDIRDLTDRNSTRSTPGYTAYPLYNCALKPLKGVPLNECAYPFHAEFASPTWNVGLSYRISPESMVYATVGRGYRSGGFSDSAQTTDAPGFLPEYVTTYEIGTKNDFNIGSMPMRVNLAGYYSDYTNIQRSVTTLLSNGHVATYVVNAASASIMGGEASIDMKPTERLSARISYAYVDPKYSSFTDQYTEKNPAYFPSGTPAGTQSVLYPVDVSDSQFTIVSHQTVTASLAYRLPIPETFGEPTFTASYYYRTSFFTLSDINPPSCAVPSDPNPKAFYANCYNYLSRLPGYGLGNLRLDWRDVFNKGFDLSFFVDNVANKYYYYGADATLSNVGTSSAYIGPPRMFGASIRIPFGH